MTQNSLEARAGSVNRLTDRIVAHPTVYDFVQRVAGVEIVAKHLQRKIELAATQGLLVDLGAGTGIHRNCVPEQLKYLSIDLDIVKLRQNQKLRKRSMLVVADAIQLPIAGASVNLVIMIMVTHHLSDDDLRCALHECKRVMIQGARLIVCDPVRIDRRLVSRGMWALDRGTFQRSRQELAQVLGQVFEIEECSDFKVLHTYAMFTATHPRDRLHIDFEEIGNQPTISSHI